jgi:hypothetical protein
MTAAITFDIDWAPDYAIDLAASFLIEHNVKSTWFVTHRTPSLDKLRARPDLFELGIHPNFMRGSSHGDEPRAVLDHCMGLVPDAVSMRTHGLLVSSDLLDIVISTTPILVDLSIFLPTASGLAPVDYWRFGRRLTRMPYCWEDNYVIGLDSCQSYGSGNLWNAHALVAKSSSVTVVNFHPIHVFLNSSSARDYEVFKSAHPDLKELRLQDAEKFINTDRPGARDALRGLVSKLDAGSTVFTKQLSKDTVTV